MSEQTQISDSEKKKEDWMNSKWRPMMGWMYMAVCTCDFVLFPVLWSLLQAVMHVTAMTQWQPLTLQGAGLFHIAMGAVLGIAAMGRTQEKIAGANNGGISTPTSGFTAPSTPSTGFSAAPGGFGSPAPATSGFGSSSGFGAPAGTTDGPAPTFGTAAPIGAGGKPVGPAQSFPAI